MLAAKAGWGELYRAPDTKLKHAVAVKIGSVIWKCRRGDLNPHGTKYRQILSLLRMPISPLRRRLPSTVYQKRSEIP